MINKNTPILLIIFFLLTPSASLLAETDKIYTIGIVPQFETKKLRRIWKPILKQLEQRTGLQFKIRGAATIPAFEKEFLAGRFDFAYMNPFHLLIGYETQGYIPLVRDHGKKLHGVLVVRKDSVIKSIKDLDSKTVAFPSPNALAASLQMRAEMHDIFNINIHPSYVKTHDSVYLNVLLKRATAGGGVQKTFNRQSDKIKNNLKIIHTTTPVAPHPLAAHPRVGKEVYNKVKQAFIDLAATDTGKKLLAKIPMKKAGPATIKDYRPLAEMKLKRFYQEN